MPTIAFADINGRVCIEKSTKKLIEYQSDNAPLGTLTQNAINAGYDKKDVEEKYVTTKEWEKIKYDNIIKPIQEQKQQKEIEKQAKKEIIKTKLNFNEDDFKNLKEALSD